MLPNSNSYKKVLFGPPTFLLHPLVYGILVLDYKFNFLVFKF